MSRRSRHTTSRFSRVRAYFGLTQRDLAALLGITESLLNHFEAGRRSPHWSITERLEPFLAQVRKGDADVPLPTAPPAGPFDPKPLEQRRAACLYHAHNLRWQLRLFPERAQQAARWAQAMPALQAALPPAAAPPPPPGADYETQLEAIRITYVRAWLDLQPLALSPDVLSQWHLLHQRALALEAEAAALGALLRMEV